MKDFKNSNKLIFTSMAILVGGLGTRLRSIVNDVPKPMAKVGDKPFLHYIIKYWSKHGVKKFYLLCGYKSEVIETYFKDKFKHINILIIKEKKLLGTGGAINFFLKTNKLLDENEYLAVLNGDTWISIKKNILNQILYPINKQMLIVCRNVPYNDRYGTLTIENDQIVKISDPNFDKSLINAGLYIAKIKFWKKIMLKFSFNENFSFEDTVMPNLANKGLLKGVICVKDFIDIGIPDDYLKLISLFKKYEI